MFQFIEIQTGEEGSISIRKSDSQGKLWFYSGIPTQPINPLQLLQYEINVMNNTKQTILDPMTESYQLDSMSKVDYIKTKLYKDILGYYIKSEKENVNFNNCRIREVVYLSTGTISIKIEPMDNLEYKPLNQLTRYDCHWNPWENNFQYPQNPVIKKMDDYELNLSFDYMLAFDPPQPLQEITLDELIPVEEIMPEVPQEIIFEEILPDAPPQFPQEIFEEPLIPVVEMEIPLEEEL